MKKARCCSIETRDRRILEKIVGYCERIDANLDRCEHSRGIFMGDIMVQDACCMCIIQIGELVSALTDETKAVNPTVPWRVIKDTRNFYVHAYGSIDLDSVWETLTNDIPSLKDS